MVEIELCSKEWNAFGGLTNTLIEKMPPQDWAVGQTACHFLI